MCLVKLLSIVVKNKLNKIYFFNSIFSTFFRNIFNIVLIEYIIMFDTFDEKKFLLKQLVKRDFTSKYKESVLGIIWSFLNLLLIMIVFILILMYASALFYPMEIVLANIQMIFSLNPYVVIVCFWDTILYGVFPDFLLLMYLAIFSIMLFGVGFLLFRIHEKKLTLQL